MILFPKNYSQMKRSQSCSNLRVNSGSKCSTNSSPTKTVSNQPSSPNILLKLLDPKTTLDEFGVYSRETAMLYVAHMALHRFGASIHGGFIRDLILRNETPTDVDIRVDGNLDQFVDNLKQLIDASGKIHCIKFYVRPTYTNFSCVDNDNSFLFKVDATCTSQFPNEGTDLTCSNIKLTQNGLAKKTNVDPYPLSVVIQHIKEKKFKVILEIDNEIQRRIQKMIDRGWKQIS